MNTIDEAKRSFPRQPGKICLNHCRISPLYRRAAEREAEFALGMADGGTEYFIKERHVLSKLHDSLGKLLGTSAENITFTKSCAEGLNVVAQGFRFKPGDEILSYANEFPSNHFPWRVAEQREGAVLKLLPNRNILGSAFDGRICAWTMEDLEAMVSSRTRILALSHVQFTSGYAGDLIELGEFCRKRGIYFVVDAAQSLGAMPIDVETMNISALACSGWKWLMGPVGSAVLFTSQDFRKHLDLVFPGPMSMKDPGDFLELRWDPLESAAKFEMSAVPMSLAAALGACVDGIFLPLGMQAIWDEILRLQGMLLKGLEGRDISPALFQAKHRSPILSVLTKKPADEIQQGLAKEGIVVSTRDRYLRLSPHFYNTDQEIAEVITRLRVLL